MLPLTGYFKLPNTKYEIHEIHKQIKGTTHT